MDGSIFNRVGLKQAGGLACRSTLHLRGRPPPIRRHARVPLVSVQHERTVIVPFRLKWSVCLERTVIVPFRLKGSVCHERTANVLFLLNRPVCRERTTNIHYRLCRLTFASLFFLPLGGS